MTWEAYQRNEWRLVDATGRIVTTLTYLAFSKSYRDNKSKEQYTTLEAAQAAAMK